MANAHDFTFRTLTGAAYPLRDCAGAPLLVVNTASKCGFTPQYEGLEALWTRYRERGLTVIGVPCNDFGGQEPGGEAEIGAFCQRNYGIDFPMMAKVCVKGPDAHPFFRWAVAEGGFLARPRWNFYKYLVGADGGLKTWFSSLAAPTGGGVLRAVERALTR